MSSGVMASTGQASTQASQSMHSSGVDVEHLGLVVIGLVGSRVDAIHRADLDAGIVLVPMHGSLITYAIQPAAP
jgi:hypothetical protein